VGRRSGDAARSAGRDRVLSLPLPLGIGVAADIAKLQKELLVARRRLSKHRVRCAVVGRPKTQNLLRRTELLARCPAVGIKARTRRSLWQGLQPASRLPDRRVHVHRSPFREQNHPSARISGPTPIKSSPGVRALEAVSDIALKS
jgi:hypothetical protein